MTNLDLYRKALRSNRIEFMNEVVVRLSTEQGTEFLIESLNNRIMTLLDDNPTPADKMKEILKG